METPLSKMRRTRTNLPNIILTFWQYIDYYSYWHGTATAYTPPEYYDELAQKDWQQKWFEFGMLNIPNPTYTDAAHKTGCSRWRGSFSPTTTAGSRRISR
ncbi:hypothetical protein HMSSN036_33600 [Paenibacillus macerans]|nr:hypothetical protein HMSSN036_33600 [Paenibacillus macerans]